MVTGAQRSNHGKESNDRMITLEGIFSPGNLKLAVEQVQANKGAPGIDGLTCDDIQQWFYDHPYELTNAIKNGTYKPLPIRRVYIPKDNGEKRPLGIPSVVDRVVQQAIAQTLSAEYDRTFSENSYGFRPNRGAHDAVKAINGYLNEGYTFVVDIDLAKFFDTVSHGKILRLLSERIKDGRVISLINKILTTKIIDGKTVIKPKTGLTQGAPCSPVLANILLDLLDKELERRGHKFARYADDLIIVCKSMKSAERTFESIKKFIEEKLLLKINTEKSKVQAITPEIKFLGFAFYKVQTKGTDKTKYRPIVHSKSKRKLVDKLRNTFLRRKYAQKIDEIKEKLTKYLMGWSHYFALGITKSNMDKVEAWMRHKIRVLYMKIWKKNKTKEDKLVGFKTNSKERCHTIAHSSLGIWAKALFANFAMTNKVIHEIMGWPSITRIVQTKAWTILGY